MKEYKVIRVAFLILLFGSFLVTKNLFAEPSFIIDAVNSEGNWKSGLITNRKVIYTDKPFMDSRVRIYVPQAGRYQLLAYVHHNWRKAAACIYVEAVDAENKTYKGYHKIEPIWYLDDRSPGRWFFISLAQNPYWELPKGELNIRFWAEAKKAPWVEETVPMEGSIAIENFFLVPIQNSESGMYLSWLINPEIGKGKWDIFDYHKLYATNLVESDKNDSILSFPVSVAKSAYYQVTVSALSQLNNNLQIIFKRKNYRQEINLELKGKDEWVLVNSKPIYLKEGSYSLALKHRNPNKIMVDYLALTAKTERTGPFKQ